MAHVSQRRAHEKKLRLRQREQRDLPGPATLRICKVVELIHHDCRYVGFLSLAQGDVGDDLFGAADNGRICVDVRVSCKHANVVFAQQLDQGEELFVDERLDRGGVVSHLAR